MGWSERHTFFERIVAMRDDYAAHTDRAGVLSVADAILYAEAVMTAVELDVEPWLIDLDRAVVDGFAAGAGSNGFDVSPGSARPPRRTGSAWRRLLGDTDDD
jgi:hypothetical protein